MLAGGLRDDLVDAIKYAFMAKGAIESGDLGGVAWRKKDGGEWHYVVELNAVNDADIVCDSAGNWRHKKFLAGDESLSPGVNYVDANDNAYEVRVFDAKAKWQEIEDYVDSWIDPWVTGSPDPAAFTNQINSLATVARQLYVGNAPALGSSGSAPSSADLDLWDALSELDISVDNTSVAVDLFQRTYATDIWKTIGGQQSLVYAAGLAMTAEADAWNQTYKSLRDFLLAATADFASFAGSGEGRGAGVDAVLGATSAVAGLLGATAGRAFPPFGIAMGLVTSTVAVGRLFNEVVPFARDESLLLEGNTYAAKWDSFKEQVKKIEADLAAAERAIDGSCDAMLKDLRSFPDNYSLTQNRKKQGDREDFERMLQSRIELLPSKLRNAAAACELIARHQAGLARILGGADAAGNPSTDVANEWTRNTLPEVGIIGSTYSGPYLAYRRLVDAAVDLLIDESKESHRVAEWLIELVIDFKDTDAGIAERNRKLRELAEEIDGYELAKGNDPHHRSSIH
ncbi:hypothetical protein GCM10027026_29270 [Myroides odoratimimus subsp. xuanwuensis]